MGKKSKFFKNTNNIQIVSNILKKRNLNKIRCGKTIISKKNKNTYSFRGNIEKTAYSFYTKAIVLAKFGKNELNYYYLSLDAKSINTIAKSHFNNYSNNYYNYFYNFYDFSIVESTTTFSIVKKIINIKNSFFYYLFSKTNIHYKNYLKNFSKKDICNKNHLKNFSKKDIHYNKNHLKNFSKKDIHYNKNHLKIFSKKDIHYNKNYLKISAHFIKSLVNGYLTRISNAHRFLNKILSTFFALILRHFNNFLTINQISQFFIDNYTIIKFGFQKSEDI